MSEYKSYGDKRESCEDFIFRNNILNNYIKKVERYKKVIV